jgi:predicted anti-sigma-YlaC factor YlaD
LKRIALILLVFGTGCARFAANRVGDALAGSGAVFASDNDPELIRQAVPFGLKLQESLLARSPGHRGLLLATSRGFTQYGYAFVQLDADELEGTNLAAATALRDRARNLYLRARDYGLRGLRAKERGFDRAVTSATRRDVPQLYWTAAAWGAAISISKNDPELVADWPKVQTLIDRALALDEAFDGGALHTFLISGEMARPGVKPAEAAARARQHFDRAVQLAGGRSASPFVAYAEAVCIRTQQRTEFEHQLNRALAVDVERRPEWRLVNLAMQRRARWLLSRTDELFLE